MSWKLSVICIICALSQVVADPIVLSPCPSESPTCLTDLISLLYKGTVTGHEPLGIPPSDPMYLERIEGDLSTVEYKLTRSTLLGFKTCDIESVRITDDRNGTVFHIFCPYFRLSGHYVIDGELIVVPIKGDGEYIVETQDYHLYVTADIYRTAGSKGRSYMSFKNFRIEGDVKGGMDVKMTNLFDGDKKSAERATHFIQDNWKQVADFLQMPILEECIKKLFTNLNKVIKTIPVDNL